MVAFAIVAAVMLAITTFLVLLIVAAAKVNTPIPTPDETDDPETDDEAMAAYRAHLANGGFPFATVLGEILNVAQEATDARLSAVERKLEALEGDGR